MKSFVQSLLLTACITTILPACAAEPAAGGETSRGRIMPPAAVTCDRNQLTSYSGAVTGYRRGAGATQLTIHTDWDTDETVRLQHSGTDAPSARFLLNGASFATEHWPLIESSPGTLADGMRATAWVCGDGVTPPLIDWQPGQPRPANSR